MDLFLSILIAFLIVAKIFPQVPIEEYKPEVVESPEPQVISKAEITTEIKTDVEAPKPSPSTTPQPSTLSEYQYPGASVVSSSESSLVLKSSDESKKITDWYKEKIKSKNFSASSFVSSSANGYVLNKLEGAGESGKISVEIKKEEGSTESTIAVNLSS